MQGYWINFADGFAGYCEGFSPGDALEIAETVLGKKASAAPRQLPYPANPIIWQFDHPLRGTCPAFCYTPERCAGLSSCPHNPSCSE